jgi:hypothetical protein
MFREGEKVSKMNHFRNFNLNRRKFSRILRFIVPILRRHDEFDLLRLPLYLIPAKLHERDTKKFLLCSPLEAFPWKKYLLGRNSYVESLPRIFQSRRWVFIERFAYFQVLHLKHQIGEIEVTFLSCRWLNG